VSLDAINADEHLAGLAVAEYEGDDIIAAYRLGRAQLDTEGAVSDAA
jgi:hypothetical protein